MNGKKVVSKKAQLTKIKLLSCSSKKAQHAKVRFLGCASKKAQLQQVFIYISAILVIGFIILFGYKMIGKVLDQKCSVEEQDFMLSITKYLDQNIRYGSRDEAVLPMACNYNVLCFVDSDALGATWQEPTTGDIYSKIDSTVMQVNAEDNISYNVYLHQQGKDITYPVAFDERIHITGGDSYMCIKPVAGSFRFMIEGQGKNGVSLSASP